MRIIFHHCTKESALADVEHKFVMLQAPGQKVTYIFPKNQQHSHVATALLEQHTEYSFLGAGFVENQVPRWGSESCSYKFKKDRPVDEEEQTECLRELSAILRG